MWTSRSGRDYYGRQLTEPEPLIPLRLSRPCQYCRQPTWFARPRQRTRGQHPLCGPTTWTDVLEPPAERAVLWHVAELFTSEDGSRTRERRHV